MGALNMNMNMNMNMNAPSASGASTRVRFNTADFRKLIPNQTPPLGVPSPLPTYPQNWDADLRTYFYLDEFIETYHDPSKHVAGTTQPPDFSWFWRLPPRAGTPPPLATIDAELMVMLNMAPDREDRFLEIIDQHDAEGAIGYFLGMLMIDPSHYPNTYLLIRAARRIGELASMCLKGYFMFPRPSQVCPAIVPMIDPPMTPSFPAGHAIQARLIALCLEDLRPGNTQRTALLDYLARRIADNRVIAGLHYPIDITAGFAVADECHVMLAACPEFAKLITLAKGEA